MHERQLLPSWNSRGDGSQTVVQDSGLYPLLSPTTYESRPTMVPKIKSNKAEVSTAIDLQKKRRREDGRHQSYEATTLADEDGDGDVAAAYQDAAAGEESAAHPADSQKTPMQCKPTPCIRALISSDGR
jgi:hypothetical protein